MTITGSSSGYARLLYTVSIVYIVHCIMQILCFLVFFLFKGSLTCVFPPCCPVQLLSVARCCASFMLCSEQTKNIMNYIRYYASIYHYYYDTLLALKH